MESDIEDAWESFALSYAADAEPEEDEHDECCSSAFESFIGAAGTTTAAESEALVEPLVAACPANNDQSCDDATIVGASLLTLGAKRSSKPVGRKSSLLKEFLADVRDSGAGPSSGASIEGAVVSSAVGSSSNSNTCVQPLEQPLWWLKYMSRDALAEGSFLAASSSMPLLHAALETAIAKDAILDDVGKNMAEFYLEKDNFHMISGALQEQLFGLSYKNLLLRLKRTAAAFLLLQRCEKFGLEHLLVNKLPDKCCVAYLDVCYYDETPMLVNIKDAVSSPVFAKDLAMQQQGLDGNSLSLPIKQLALSSLTTKAKLLQVQSGFGFLLEISGCPIFIYGSMVKPVTAMAKNDATAILTELLKASDVSSAASHFQLLCRGVCLDKGPANMLCEKLLIGQRSGLWHALQLACDCHVIHTCFKKTYALVDTDISGLIAWALSIREGGKFALWRQALAQEILSRQVKFIVAPLAKAAQEYKSHMIDLLFSKDKTWLVRLTALKLVMNGDWRNGKELEFVVPGGQPFPDKKKVQALMVNVLLFCLASTQPVIFPRHRWSGASESLAYICSLGAVHNLLEPTYMRFLDKVQGQKGNTSSASAAHSQECHVSLPTAFADVAGLHDTAMVDAIADQELTSKGQDLSQAGLSDSTIFSALNAKNRTQAFAWLELHPLFRLLLMKIVAGPLTSILALQLQASGADYEQLELSKMASAMMSGSMDIGSRSFPLVLASSGELEDNANGEYGLLLSASIWQVVPATCRTLSFRALCHRLLSRAAASIFQLLSVPHRQFPIALFRLLKDPSASKELEEQPDCIKDEWTLALQHQFGHLHNPLCLGLIQAQAQSLKTDISTVESNHSSIRRLLVARSLQTHSLNVEACSAEWVLQNCRRRCRGVKKKQKKQQGQESWQRNPTQQPLNFETLACTIWIRTCGF
eukprot:6462242-Amphidinium_carterae.2